mmetsp:Transcript_38974/g.43088  ORF Transcript_38974/g.43088 Transcript_38974/m.43088 type:complete len:82 (+) Transcript_38974:650-895(+)
MVPYFRWEAKGVTNSIIKDGAIRIVTTRTPTVNYQRTTIKTLEHIVRNVEVNEFSGGGLATSCNSRKSQTKTCCQERKYRV